MSEQATNNRAANAVAEYLWWIHPSDDAVVNFGVMNADEKFLGFTTTVGRFWEQSGDKLRIGDERAVWCSIHKAKQSAVGRSKLAIADVDAWQFLSFDVDAVQAHAEKRCATDAEKRKVKAIADNLAASLANDFPQPLVADTGNGYFVAFPIELPVTDENQLLMTRLLSVFKSIHDNEDAEIDNTSVDPSHIFGVVGTLNASKTATDDAPHRIRSVVGEYPSREPMGATEFVKWARDFIRLHDSLAMEYAGDDAGVVAGEVERSGWDEVAGEDKAKTAREMLSIIPNNKLDYSEWIKVGAALHSADSSEAMLKAWIDWTATYANFTEKDNRNAWRSMDKSEPNKRKKVGIGTLVYLAKKYNADGYERWRAEHRSVSQGTASGCTGVQSPNAIELRYATTDVGNAEHFAATYGKDCRWVNEWKKWIVWDGKRWKVDVGGNRVARKVIAFVRRDLPIAADGDKDRLKWAIASQARTRIDNIEKLASKMLSIDAADLDRDGWLFNLRNGTIDLRTGELREHRREDLLTKLAPVDFDATAIAPVWEKFLARIFQDDDGKCREQLVAYLQKALGYSLTADVSEQCFFILHGAGRNGKTTLMETVKSVMGDYAHTAPETLLMKRDNKGSANNDDEADLFGVRLAACSETNEGQRFDESKAKRLSGNKDVTAMRKFEHPFTFLASHKLWLDCNHLPRVSGDDFAMKRRVKTIPFTQTIRADEMDAKLGEKLQGESSGILNWLLAGLKCWRAEGLNNREPSEVLAAVNNYFDENDELGAFLRDRCERNNAAKVETSRIFAAYNLWYSSEGLRETCKLPKPKLMTALAKRGYENKPSSGKRYVWGLDLIAGADDAEVWSSNGGGTDGEKDERVF